MLSCRKSNANVWNNNLETQDFRTASRVQPTFSRRFEKSTRPTDSKNARAPFATPGRPTPNNIQPPPNVGAPLVTPGRPTQCRKTADAKQHSTARKRGGATCDARTTDAKQRSTAPKRGGATCEARMTTAKPQNGRNKTTNRPQHATSADAQRGRPIVPFRHRAS